MLKKIKNLIGIQSLRYPIDMLQPSSAEKGTSEEAEKEDKNNYFNLLSGNPSHFIINRFP